MNKNCGVQNSYKREKNLNGKKLFANQLVLAYFSKLKTFYFLT
jgi:hypothetical protein